MARPIKYKPPRRINLVSVTLLLLAVGLGYAAYQYLPIVFLEQEAYRVLEETGSKFAGSKGLYRQDSRALQQLRSEMNGKLRGIGVQDPNMETWIEVNGPEVRVGTVFSAWLHWPFDLLAPREIVAQPEHRFEI